jgi:hypothetical protein
MADERESIQCTACKKRFFEEGFKVNRLGRRLKTCLECNARDKAKRERNKCPHGKRKWDCIACSPGNFCEHGKCKARHTCDVCDPAGNERRKHLHNAREFATQAGGWPYEHVRCWAQDAYDENVRKWKAVFDKLLTDNDIDVDLHAMILANLKPWDAEGHARRQIEIMEERRMWSEKPPMLTDDELVEILGFAL